MFEKILIANRGEVALRIIRACPKTGIATVAMLSTADADAMHVKLADELVLVGPRPPARILSQYFRHLAACEITGAGDPIRVTGFYRENANFGEIRRRTTTSPSSARARSISA